LRVRTGLGRRDFCSRGSPNLRRQILTQIPILGICPSVRNRCFDSFRSTSSGLNPATCRGTNLFVSVSVKKRSAITDFSGANILAHAEGVRDLSPGWSEAEPWVLDSRMRCALKERQMFAPCLHQRFAGRVLLQDSRAERLRAFYSGLSDRLNTRSPVYKPLPLLQSGLPNHVRTQGSASLHPGLLISVTPSAYSQMRLPIITQLRNLSSR
jgi:hypothetical protein